MVFKRFLVSFGSRKSMQKATRKKKRRAILIGKNQYGINVGTFARRGFSCQNRWKLTCFQDNRFWEGFGRILGRFWKAKNLDFRSFFHDFSKRILITVVVNEKSTIIGVPGGGGDSKKQSTFRAGPSYARIFNILRILGAQNQHSTRPEAFGLGGLRNETTENWLTDCRHEQKTAYEKES